MGSLVGGVLGTIGGVISGNKAASAQRAQAEQLRQAGQQAFDASRFRPVGITSRFGSSNFTVDPTTGAMTGAGYTASPEVAALQDQLFSQMSGQGMQAAQGALGAQQGLFNLGQQYLAQSPQQAAQDWMASQQALLAPSREQGLASVRQGLFNKGRGGLSIAQGGNLQATNPEMAAFANAQAMQDLQLAAQAQQQGRAQTQFGAGLFGTGLDLASAGYNPLKTQFGLAQGLEQAAQQPLTLGTELGSTASRINAQAANMRLNPQMSAAAAQAKANSWSPWGAALSGMGGQMGGWSNPFSSVPPMTAASSTGGWGTGDYFGNQDLGAYL